MKKAVFWVLIAAVWFAYYQYILPGKISALDTGSIVISYKEMVFRVERKDVQDVKVTPEGRLSGRSKKGQKFVMEGTVDPELMDLLDRQGVRATVQTRGLFGLEIWLAVVFIIIAYLFSMRRMREIQRGQ